MLPKKIHQLEEDIIQFKASQGLGSSNSRIIKVANINESGTYSLNKYIVGVFTSTALHPLIVPRVVCRSNGNVCRDRFINGVRQTNVDTCEITYDQTMILGTLSYWGDANNNTFNEHTSAFMITLYPPDGIYTDRSYSIEGDLYATGEGTLKIFSYDP